MKTRFSICLSILALAATAYSEDDGDQGLLIKTPPALAARRPRIEPDGTLHLFAGSLPEVIAQLEQVIPSINPDWSLPNVIIDEAARNLRVPADLRLRKVTPVQAVALIAAAAGCALEPIVAPHESPPLADHAPADARPTPHTTPLSASSAVVGYRIVAGTAQPKTDDLSGIGISLSSKDGVITVGEVYPNTPAARSGKLNPGDRLISVRERGNPPVSLAGMPVEKVAKLIRGAAGSSIELQVQSDHADSPVSIPITREKMPLPGPAWPSNPTVKVVTPAGAETLGMTSASPNAIVTLSPTSSAAAPLQWSPADPYGTFSRAAEPTAPIVRVYAIGALFSGTEDEALQKENAFRELVSSALQEADPNRKTQPALSFHNRSKALIVKATPADHALIQEILAAMKENQTSDRPSAAGRR
jgi:hypothetical protein